MPRGKTWAGTLHIFADAAHLLAAGAWLGGLFPLGRCLLGSDARLADGEALDLDSVLMRFSGTGYLAVATLIGTGLVNSWFLIGSVFSLMASAYADDVHHPCEVIGENMQRHLSGNIL